MKNIMANLIGKKFSVYVGEEFERMTDFIGLMKLLAKYSDFFEYSRREQVDYLRNSFPGGCIRIDSNIFVKVGK